MSEQRIRNQDWPTTGKPADPELEHIDRLQRLINACDDHRPLGPDGKHGNRHTPTCGCEDA